MRLCVFLVFNVAKFMCGTFVLEVICIINMIWYAKDAAVNKSPLDGNLDPLSVSYTVQFIQMFISIKTATIRFRTRDDDY